MPSVQLSLCVVVWNAEVEPDFDYSTWAPDKKPEQKSIRNASLSKALREELVGVVRNQSFKTGNWFVECDEVFQEFQVDVMVYQWEMPRGAGIGDAIVFKIKPPRPDANHVNVIPGVQGSISGNFDCTCAQLLAATYCS